MWVYEGVTLRAEDVGAALSAATAGRVPQGRRPPKSPVEPAGWVDGLLAGVAGGPLENAVRRSISSILRTGNSQQLAVLAPLAASHDLFDADALQATLDRPHAFWNVSTAVHLASAIAARVVDGRTSYAVTLRPWARDWRIALALLPAWVRADGDWALDHLPGWIDAVPTEAACALAAALDGLDAATAAEWRRRVAAFDLSPASAAAAATAAPALFPAAPVVVPPPEPSPAAPAPVLRAAPRAEPEEAPPPTAPSPVTPKIESAPSAMAISLRRPVGSGAAALPDGGLPWHSEDDRWFVVPADRPIPNGPMLLRRGWRSRWVEPAAVAAFEIDAAVGRAMRAQRLEQLVDRARASMEPTALVAKDPALEAVIAEVQRTLDAVLGRRR